MNRFALLILLLVSPASAAAEPAAGAKKLIQYGWDVPDTAYFRANLTRMEASPFDGVMVTVRAQPGPGKLGGTDALGWRAFQRKRFTPKNYQHAIDDLKASRSSTLTDNFIVLISQPEGGGFDWFDDELWASTAHNIGVLAKVAKQGGCKGLMFDPEEYAGPVWSYATMPEAARKAHAYDAYAAKVRERGRGFIRAVNAEYPDVTILALFGPSLFRQYVSLVGEDKAAEAHYNLLVPFYDGVLEAASEKTVLVDGYEVSYPFKTEDQFVHGRHDILELSRKRTAVPDAFDKHVRAGFGLWLDHTSGQRGGWFPDDPTKNHFTPEQWQTAVSLALKHSDEYVWVYNERARWWDSRPGEAYERATAAARKSAGQR